MKDYVFSRKAIKERMITNMHSRGLAEMRAFKDAGIRPLIIYPEDLFIFNDESFITESYKAVLNRSPDKKGLKNNLKLLKSRIPKSYILYLMIKSKERKNISKNIIIKGHFKLAMKYYLYSLMKLIVFINKDFFLNFHKNILYKLKGMF